MSDCRICGNGQDNRAYTAHEMHLGLGEPFEYFQCVQCGCLQIREVPQDLSKYYPQNYYSYRPASATLDYSRPGLGGYKQRFILKQLTKYYFGRKSGLGAWLVKRSTLARD